MYILFALLVWLLLLVFVRVFLWSRASTAGAFALWSLIVLVANLATFNAASLAVGIDLGPLHSMSYNIPSDWIDKGALGMVALLPYCLGCAAPLVVRGLART